MTVRMVLSGSSLEADILVRRLKDVPGVTVRYRDEEWSEAVLSTVYDVELDIEEFLKAERRAIEAEAEP